MDCRAQKTLLWLDCFKLIKKKPWALDRNNWGRLRNVQIFITYVFYNRHGLLKLPFFEGRRNFIWNATFIWKTHGIKLSILNIKEKSLWRDCIQSTTETDRQFLSDTAQGSKAKGFQRAKNNLGNIPHWFLKIL